MNKRLMLALALLFVLGLSVLGFGPALAADGYTLFGDAALVSPGSGSTTAAQLRSDATVPPWYGGVDFDVPAGTTWAGLVTLGTEFNVTDDDCGGGSPRITLGIDTNNDNSADGYVHVALGPSPNFTGCSAGWQSTGNLIGNNDAGRYDFSQFGGSPFTTYSNAPASVTGGNVVAIFIVVDASWMFPDGEQTILVDNVQINGTTYTFESKDSCKHGGWQNFASAPGPFKNQGDCVSYFASGH